MSSASHYSPTPEETAISRLLRAYREHQGLTAAVLAESIGVTPATYRRIEQGERPVSLLQLQQICRVLSIELDDLADGAKRLTPERSPKLRSPRGSACHANAPCTQQSD
ncbi:helix-turn-helix domain-containing protein [Lacipirellula sp.]|uniref:helix-turn-helix domain-containing protein n=1 Tax=Lacipirellula sp. TaxID=2691419 RepID=UPI003D14C0B8